MKEEFSVVISAPPHRKHPVAECYHNSTQFAEVIFEEDFVVCELYTYPDINMWEFTFDEVVAIFDKAKRKLLCEE